MEAVLNVASALSSAARSASVSAGFTARNATCRHPGAAARVQAIRPASEAAARAAPSSVSELCGLARAETTEKRWAITTELSPAFGGVGGEPAPGVLARAALGSCLALGYQLRAAEHGLAFDRVRVTVEADSDVRGMLDPIDAIPPGPLAWRYHVEIDTAAAPDDVEAIVADADRISPVLDMLIRPQAISRTVSIRQPDTRQPTTRRPEVA